MSYRSECFQSSDIASSDNIKTVALKYAFLFAAFLANFPASL